MRVQKKLIGWVGLSRRPKHWRTTERYALAVRAYLRNASGEGDADNYVKLIKDALQGIAWANDRQVAFLIVAKIIGGPGEPRSEVEIVVVQPTDDLAARASLGAA